MADGICICGNEVPSSISSGRPRKHCSKACSNRAARLRGKPCSVDGCDRPQLARKLCPPHYSNWHRLQLKYTITCHCGKTAQVQKRRTKHCSYKCAMDAVNAAKAGMPVQEWLNRPDSERGRRRPKAERSLKQCAWCLQLHSSQSTYCSQQCAVDRESQRRQRITQIEEGKRFRISFESGDSVTFFEELKLRSSVDGNGCWIWQRRLKSGYPVHKFGKKQVQVHRLSLEAKHGKPLGTQAAHHICANAACVNPDHLQPVTFRENTAEMMQRKAYLDRIAELETALAEVSPGHRALNVIEVV